MTAPHQNLLGMSGGAVDTEETDPNFNQTVLLLHGDGTNGGQNNTFVDSSSSGHTITRSGNSTQGTFNPFLGEGQYSVFIDDSTSAARLEFPDSTDFAFASGQAFTVECFVYFTAINASDTILMIAAGGGFTLKIDSTGNNLAACTYSGSDVVKGAVSIGTFHHIAYVRDSSNNASFFVDGTRTETTTDNTSYSDQALRVGCTTVNDCFAYINNLRVTRSEVYDASSSSLTVPTTALSALADTVLLTCQSNRFVDNSLDARVPSIISNNNTPKVIPFSPFAPTASYSESVHGGSAYFDGTGDKLTVAYGDSIGAGDFTISAWVYRTSNGTYPVILDTRSSDADTKPVIYTDGANLYYYTAGNIRITGSSAINNNVWIFIRLVKESNVTKLFVNGTQVGSDYSDSNNYTPTNDWEIGSRHNDLHYWPGYISNLQVVLTALDGTSVPTAPFTSNANTKLLLNFTNAEIIDNTMKNNLETVDAAQIDTSVKKFGTGSIQFDGSGDYLTGINQPYLILGKGSYTFECFVYITTGVQVYHGLLSIVGGIQFQLSNELMRLSSTANAMLVADAGDEVALNTWTHLAFVKDGATNSLKFFKDGTLIKTGTDSYNSGAGVVVSNWTQTGALQVGRIFNIATYDIEGYIDEARLTLAPRYSSTFTAPTKAFANR